MGSTYSILDTNKNTQKPNLSENNPTVLEVLSGQQQDSNLNTSGTIKKDNVGDRFIGDFVSYSRSTLSEKVLSNFTGRFGVSQVQQ